MGRKKRTCKWVKAEGTSLTEISRFVQDWLSLQEVYRDSRKERYLVELAVIEACTNIIRYAYPASSPGNLGVCLARAGDSIEILLLDEGAPFDPTGVASTGSSSIPGRGLRHLPDANDHGFRHLRKERFPVELSSPRPGGPSRDGRRQRRGRAGRPEEADRQREGEGPMMQDNSPGVSLEEILGSEEVSGFLETLSALVEDALRAPRTGRQGPGDLLRKRLRL